MISLKRKNATKLEELTEFVIIHYKRDEKANTNERIAIKKLIESKIFCN